MMESKTKGMVVLYVAASSMMLVLNKGAITLIPAPGSVLWLIFPQRYGTGLHFSGRATLNLKPARAVAIAYSTVSCVFLVTLFANIKILEHAGVNAFIIVCVLDYLCMGRKLPNLRSTLSISTTALCCFMYIRMKSASEGDTEWGPSSVFWVCAWYGLFVFDQVFIKAIVDKYPASGWERTLYQNFFAFVIAAVALVFQPPTRLMANTSDNSLGWAVVLGSCVIGALLSYAGLSLRGDITATMFTVLGVGCKMFSILLNEAFLQPTSDKRRLLFIAMAVVASALYQQAPKRAERKAQDEASNV